MALSISSPRVAGDLVTLIPEFSKNLIFSLADPFPPETIAPACPILLSGGAVTPAMKETTGLF